MIITDVVQITINEQIDPVFDSWDMNQDVYVPYMTGIIADINNWYCCKVLVTNVRWFSIYWLINILFWIIDRFNCLPEPNWQLHSDKICMPT